MNNITVVPSGGRLTVGIAQIGAPEAYAGVFRHGVCPSVPLHILQRLDPYEYITQSKKKNQTRNCKNAKLLWHQQKLVRRLAERCHRMPSKPSALAILTWKYMSLLQNLASSPHWPTYRLIVVRRSSLSLSTSSVSDIAVNNFGAC